jgi:hypothetical protein
MSSFIATTTRVSFSLELMQLVVQEPEPKPVSAAVDEGLTAIAQYDYEYEVRVRALIRITPFDRPERKTSFPSSKVNISCV